MHLISLHGETIYSWTVVETEAESEGAGRRVQKASRFRVSPQKAAELTGPSSSHRLCAKLDIITNITCLQCFRASWGLMSLLHAKCFEHPDDEHNITPECHRAFSLLSLTWAKRGEHNHGASSFNGCRKCGSWDTTGFHSASVSTDERDVSDVWAINCLFCDEAQLSLLGAGIFVFWETKLGLMIVFWKFVLIYRSP